MNKPKTFLLSALVVGALLLAGCTSATTTSDEVETPTLILAPINPQFVLEHEIAKPIVIEEDRVEIYLDAPIPETIFVDATKVRVEFYNRAKSTLEDEGTMVELYIPSVNFIDILRFNEHVDIMLSQGVHEYMVVERDVFRGDVVGERSGIIEVRQR